MKNNLGAPESTAPSVPKRRHRIREILLGFVVLVVLVMITPAVLALFFRDIQPVSAPDFVLSKVTIPVAENAYFDLIKLEQAAVDVPELSAGQGFLNGVLAGVRWDQAVVDDALAKNAEALRYFVDAAQKPSFQEPSYADPAALDVTYFPKASNWWSVFRTAALNAINLQKQGKEQEAFQQAMDVVRVGRNIERSQGPLIIYLIGANLKMLGLQTVQRLLMETKLPGAALLPYATQRENVAAESKDLSNALIMEHLFRIGYIEEAVQPIHAERENVVEYYQQAIPWRLWVPKSYYFQPNKIIAEWTATDRNILDAITTPCTQDAPKIHPPARYATNMLRYWLRLYFLPNAIGQILQENGFVDISSIRTKICNDGALNSATQTLIALKAYFQDKGTLPPALSELVPAYLSSVPTDPYDGAAIKYSATKKVVYSVGNDHTDTGGSTGDDWTKMDDPTFIIN